MTDIKEIIAESIAKSGFELPPIQFNVPIIEMSYDQWEALMEEVPWRAKLLIMLVLIGLTVWGGMRALKLR